MAFRHLLAACVLVPGLAAAAELGRLTLLSGVGEPLRAEIEILSVQPAEAGSLAARIPPPEVFWRANLEPSPVLDRVRVAVERRPKNRFVVVLRSSAPFDEPFVQLLVELTSPAGSAVREYPFLLDEPRARDPRDPRELAAPVPPQLEAAPEPIRRPAAPRAARERPDGYLVKPGDTLAEIARGLTPPGATLDQTIVALFQANEQAFVEANLNRLRVGQTLGVPAPGAIAALEAAEARRILLAHGAAFDAYRRQLAGSPAPARPSPAPEARASAEPQPAPKVMRDQLRVSRTEAPEPRSRAAASARGDDLTSLQRALAEAQERIGLLEKSIDDVRMLLMLKDQQLARMERRAAAEGGASMPGDAAASDTAYDGRGAGDQLSRFLDHYGGWLILGFVVGFASWILMPFKTVRLWRKKRRRRERDLHKRHGRRVRRAARDAGLLSTSA